MQRHADLVDAQVRVWRNHRAPTEIHALAWQVSGLHKLERVGGGMKGLGQYARYDETLTRQIAAKAPLLALEPLAEAACAL